MFIDMTMLTFSNMFVCILYRIHHNQITSNQMLLPTIDRLRDSSTSIAEEYKVLIYHISLWNGSMAFNFSFVGSSFFLYSWCCFCMVSYFSKLCLVTNHTEVLCHSHSRLLHCWIGEQLVPSLPSYVYNIFLIHFVGNVFHTIVNLNTVITLSLLMHMHVHILECDCQTSVYITIVYLFIIILNHTMFLYLYEFFFIFYLYRIE